jgi:hypothetical protein
VKEKIMRGNKKETDIIIKLKQENAGEKKRGQATFP